MKDYLATNDSVVDVAHLLKDYARIVIAGPPRSGKSTLAVRASERYGLKCLHSDALAKSMEWSEVSEEVSHWFDHLQGKWICEGVVMARAIRKWLQRHDKKDFFPAAIVLLENPIQMQSPGQVTMSKGCATVWEEIEPELIRRHTKIIRRDV